MKRMLCALLLICAFAVQTSAQEIYKEVKTILDQYEKEKNDTLKNIETRKIATFKWDAIYYLLLHSEGLSESEVGKQTSAMIDFVNIYLKRLQGAGKSKKARELVAGTFKSASLKHPRVLDTEKEVAYAYVDHPKFITQFSLDTDWVKALRDVK